MSRRYIDPDIWTKLYGTKSSAKLVACYLQVSAHNPAGIFRIRPEEIAMNTGLKTADVHSALEELAINGSVMWDSTESLVFLPGYAEVQGINPKVARSINNELVRLGPSPLTVRAAQIPHLKAQDPTGWDRVYIAYGEGMHTLQSVCLSSLKRGESEGGGRKRKPKKWVEDLLDAARDHWPKVEGRLYRFDRADARREILKLKDPPMAGEVEAGVKRWSVEWSRNGFQHKASTFFRERLWEQATNGKKAKQITARALIKGGDG